ncbi:unnamed protein product, partial [Prunus brigantina]
KIIVEVECYNISKLQGNHGCLFTLNRVQDVFFVEGGCSSGKCGPGNVFLVGTGLGDSELLTLMAYRVFQNADLLLYDRLVSNDVLELVDSGARLLYVGKTAGYHSRTQVKH